MARRNSECIECDAFETLSYDVVTGGYVCEKCGMLYSAESVECGDYDRKDKCSECVHCGENTCIGDSKNYSCFKN